MEFQALRLSCRGFVALFVLLVCGASEVAVGAQAIKIKLVNGRSGRPMTGACVNVWVGGKRKEAMAIPTDKDGVGLLYFTDENAEINTQNQWKSCGGFGVINPVVKYADTIRINAGYVLCRPHRPDYSWLAMTEFSTSQVVQKGIVTPNACGRATASAEPGEVILFVRPLTWWEKLKQ